MAWMNQEKKAKIAVSLKEVVPKGWKYSLRVRNHSTLEMTISAAPVDLLAHVCKVFDQVGTIRPGPEANYSVNSYYLERQFEGELLETFKKIKGAMNLDNFDHSDPMTDYFHVGHYIDISIGNYERPFKVAA